MVVAELERATSNRPILEQHIGAIAEAFGSSVTRAPLHEVGEKGALLHLGTLIHFHNDPSRTLELRWWENKVVLRDAVGGREIMALGKVTGVRQRIEANGQSSGIVFEGSLLDIPANFHIWGNGHFSVYR